MKSLSDQNVKELSSVETSTWVVDVFGNNDKVKRKSRRPPSYNPEDYVLFFRKLITSTNTNGSNYSAVEKLYGKNAFMNSESKSKTLNEDNSQSRTNKSTIDFSDILKKLRQDISFSFASFCKEFSGDKCDGISVLMDLLRNVQMAQTELNGSNVDLSSARANRRTLIRISLTDELEILLCLNQLCLANGRVPGNHGCSRLLDHKSGFYGLASALIGSLTRSRSIALQLMTAVCKMPGGHSRLSEALTTLRLNMGESVRLKILSGIVNSSASRVESLMNKSEVECNETFQPSETETARNVETSLRFLVEAMAFLNAFVQFAPDLRSKVVIQWEVEEAALNIHALSQVADSKHPHPTTVQLKQELAIWHGNQINVTLLLDRLNNVNSTNEALRRDLESLRTRLIALESEKVHFSEIESDMKKRCEDLENELTTLRSAAPSSSFSSSVGVQTENNANTKEGISLLEMSPNCNTKALVTCEEEEYSIDDVIAELDELVHSAESEMKFIEKHNANSSSSRNVAHYSGEYQVESIKNINPTGTISEACSFSNQRGMQQEATDVKFTLHNSKLHLGLDLCGETSDFNTLRNSNPVSSDSEMFCGPSEISRKKITALNALTFNGVCDAETEWDDVSITKSDCKRENRTKKSLSKSNKSLNDKQSDRLRVKKENIQPDLLHAVPGQFFNKSWDFLEVCSPVYANNSKTDLINREKNRRRHASEDNLTSISKDVPIFIHPTVHHPSLQDDLIKIQNQNPFSLDWNKSSIFRSFDQSEAPMEVSAHLDALQIGDVFSFPSQLSQVRDVGHIGRDGRKTKQDQLNSWKSNKQAFVFSSLIPGFLKSFHGNSSSRDLAAAPLSKNTSEYDHSQANYHVMDDYRQHFHSQPMNSFHSRSNERIENVASSEFWPASFQALPFRNIPPQYTVDVKRGSDQSRTSDASHSRDPLTSPQQISRKTQMKKFTKLIDQDPSGLY